MYGTYTNNHVALWVDYSQFGMHPEEQDLKTVKTVIERN